MKKIVLIAVFVFIFVSFFSLNAQWAKTYGEYSGNMAFSIEQTDDGGYVVAGYTNSFGAGNSDFWVLKLYLNGEIQWEKRYGGSSDDVAYEVHQTKDHGFIVVGYTASFGDLNYDIWVLKLFPNGEISWQRTYSSEFQDIAYSIDETADGGYILAGYTLSNVPGQNPLVMKLSATGAIEWQRIYYGSYVFAGGHFNSICQIEDGGYIAACVNGDFGVYNDIWVVKLLSNGDVEWQKIFVDQNNELAFSIQKTNGGGYIVAGLGGTGGGDFWILKLLSDGNIDWQRSYDGDGGKFDQAQSIKETKDGGYIVVGYSETPGAVDWRDCWALKLFSNGDVEWERRYNASDFDLAFSANQTNDGGYIIAGQTSMYNTSKSDLLILKTSSSGDIDPSCGNLVIPSHAIISNTNINPQNADTTPHVSNLTYNDTNIFPYATYATVTLLCQAVVPDPVILSLTPNSGPVGTEVTISGSNFGSTQGTGTVTFNGTVAPIIAWNDTEVKATVPSGASTGAVVVHTSVGKDSNGVIFTVSIIVPAPSISQLSPDSGPVGTQVAISGSNFGSTQGTVKFNGAVTSITSWMDTEILTVVPGLAGPGPGPVVVLTSDGRVSNEKTFTVTASLRWRRVDNGPWDPDCDNYFGAIAIHPANPDTIYIGNYHPEKGCGLYKSTDGGHSWAPINTGISKIGPRQFRHYPSVFKIAITPSNPRILYASLGSVGSFPIGDIYRSLNGGRVWVRINGTGKNKIKGLPLDIAVSYQNPRIVYVSTGGKGIFKTTDGGAKWKRIKKPTIGAYDVYSTIKIAPSDPNLLYTTGFTNYNGSLPIPGRDHLISIEGVLPLGPFRSINAGESWANINNPHPGLMPAFLSDLVIKPTSGDSIYASTMSYIPPLPIPNANRGIFKSTDAGNQWEAINNAGDLDLSQCPIYKLLFYSSTKTLIYALAGFEGLFVSDDDGEKWQRVTRYGLPSSTFIGELAASENRLMVLTNWGIYILDLNRVC